MNMNQCKKSTNFVEICSQHIILLLYIELYGYQNQYQGYPQTFVLFTFEVQFKI